MPRSPILSSLSAFLPSHYSLFNHPYNIKVSGEGKEVWSSSLHNCLQPFVILYLGSKPWKLETKFHIHINQHMTCMSGNQCQDSIQYSSPLQVHLEDSYVLESLHKTDQLHHWSQANTIFSDLVHGCRLENANIYWRVLPLLGDKSQIKFFWVVTLCGDAVDTNISEGLASSVLLVKWLILGMGVYIKMYTDYNTEY